MRVQTPAVQGDDSWIEIIPLTWGEYRTLGELDGGETLALVCRHLSGWNWRDGEGRPLAQPGGDAACLDALTGEEVKALAAAVLTIGDAAELKAIREKAMTVFFTGIGELPDEAAELMLCDLYHCPPSMLDQQDAARMARHLAYLRGKAEGRKA